MGVCDCGIPNNGNYGGNRGGGGPAVFLGLSGIAIGVS